MHYVSTRGQAPNLSFEDVVLAGLASDGGLYLPSEIPQLSTQHIAELQGLDYADLAYEIMHPFMGDIMDEPTLRQLLRDTYDGFHHRAVAPLSQVANQHWMLELYHGPTLAFKDFALQFLGRLVDHILQKRDEKVVVLGATSGDTGSAAIAGCRGRDNMQIFILHPHERVSDVQRRQMTTVGDDNVHNIALEGAFDDCQDIVKSLFADAEFRKQHHLVAVNSINWARILAQVVYYFYAALQLGAPSRRIAFCVPTGNFGDIYAGYIARQMGLPIERLIIATNRNDILHRCVSTGTYGMEGVHPSLSPSMDIQISSNFERLLFDLHDRDADTIRNMMDTFRKDKSITLSAQAHLRLQSIFSSAAVDDEDTLRVIGEVHRENGVLLDPHTAVGIRAAQRCELDKDVAVVTLSTAHPAKFPHAVKDATGQNPELPEFMADLWDKQEQFDVLPNSRDAICDYIGKHGI